MFSKRKKHYIQEEQNRMTKKMATPTKVSGRE
jgi:hypothetical protein